MPILNIIRSRLTILAVTCGLGFLLWQAWSQINELKKDKSRLNHALVVKSDSLEVYRNENGMLVYKADAMELKAKEFRQLYETGQYEWIRQFESVNKRLKNLEAAQSIDVKITERIETGLIDSVSTVLDSIGTKAWKLEYRTEFTTLSGIVTIDSSANFAGDLEVKVPLKQVITSYREGWRLFGKRRKWLPFGPQRLSTEVLSLNPNAKIDHIETIYIDGKK